MSAATSHKGVILIVDDNPSNLNVLSRQLKEEGLKVLIATEGELAIKRAQHVHPDLILLDVVMPDMDGFELCRRLKSDPLTQEIPVLFITMLTEMVDKIKGFEAGGVDYITKPFQTQEVMARINAHLTIRRLHRQVQRESERFRSLAEATFEGIIIHDGARTIEVNQTVVTLFGYPREELLGRAVLSLFANGELLSVNEEVQGLRRDGQTIPLEIQTRPLSWQEQTLWITVIQDMTWRRRVEKELRTLHATLDERDRLGELVGKSPAMHKVYDRLISAAASNETVIIYGETGTGKELAARTLFALSEQHTARFVPVNCGTLQETLFESRLFGYYKGAFTGAERDTPGYFDEARGGMLFLDEVGELSPAMQTTLLRVLNDGLYTPVGARTGRQADVRIIAATHQNLRDLVRSNKVREDFFQRLHVIALEMPPLRQRREDIPLLIRHFLSQRESAGDLPPTIPADVIEQFMTYEWPGNVRELYNELRRYVTTGEIELGGVRSLDAPADLGEMPFLQPGLPLTTVVEAFEQYYIDRTLKHCQGQRSKAAAALGVSRGTLYAKMKK